MDYLCIRNDVGEFEKSICDMYPKELEIKVEYQNNHATFLNLDGAIKEGTFVYKLFDKKHSFSFLFFSFMQKSISLFFKTIQGEF